MDYQTFYEEVRALLKDEDGEWRELNSCADVVQDVSFLLDQVEEAPDAREALPDQADVADACPVCGKASRYCDGDHQSPEKEDAQVQREDEAAGVWTVDCAGCAAVLVWVQRHEPVMCPNCGRPDIEVTPGGSDAS